MLGGRDALSVMPPPIAHDHPVGFVALARDFHQGVVPAAVMALHTGQRDGDPVVAAGADCAGAGDLLAAARGTGSRPARPASVTPASRCRASLASTGSRRRGRVSSRSPRSG